MTNQPGVNRTRTLIDQMLDKGYTRATAQTIRAIAHNGTTGVMEARLSAFEAEAARLQAAGKPMTRDNPYYRALMADFETALRKDAALIDASAERVQRVGLDAAKSLTRQLALPGMSDQQLEVLGVKWNTPDPDAIARIAEYTTRPAWQAQLDQYAKGSSQAVQDTALRAIVEGRNPLTVAREVRRVVEGLPARQANNLMRTLQLTAYRDATAMHQLANADILSYQVRIASLDRRCCMACIALHGTKLPLGQRVNDHHQGRCIAISVTTFRPRNIQTGEAWFAGQPEPIQRQYMGNAAYEAWQAGKIKLADFPQPYDDPTFGPMIREASLKGMLGDSAQQFYGRDAA